MEGIFGIITVPAIMALSYFFGICAKAAPLNDKYIPIICGFSGIVLGVVGFYVMPNFPAQDIISAMAVGVASGLAATGVNQIIKQLKGSKE